MKKQKVKIVNESKNPLPKYETKFSAGFDVRVDFSKIEEANDLIGNGRYAFGNLETGKEMLLNPNGRVLIPTGLRFAIPDGYELQIRARSGLALKHGISIVNGIGTLDSDYRGFLGVIILNTDLDTFRIKDGDRIAQCVLNKVDQCDWEEVESVEYLDKTVRGEGGFGHTGQN